MPIGLVNRLEVCRKDSSPGLSLSIYRSGTCAAPNTTGTTPDGILQNSTEIVELKRCIQLRHMEGVEQDQIGYDVNDESTSPCPLPWKCVGLICPRHLHGAGYTVEVGLLEVFPVATFKSTATPLNEAMTDHHADGYDHECSFVCIGQLHRPIFAVIGKNRRRLSYAELHESFCPGISML